MNLFEELGDISEVEELCKEIRRNSMDGLNKFKAEIQAEVDKVTEEKKKAYAKAQADIIIKHIKSVCDEEYDGLLNQEHKSFRRMWTFVKDKAKERAIDGCAFVDDATVFGWIDEYVGLDDKAEVEAEKKQAEERAKKAEEKAKKTETKKKGTSGKGVYKEIEKVQAEIKERHEIEDADQVSIFDLM